MNLPSAILSDFVSFFSSSKREAIPEPLVVVLGMIFFTFTAYFTLLNSELSSRELATSDGCFVKLWRETASKSELLSRKSDVAFVLAPLLFYVADFESKLYLSTD